MSTHFELTKKGVNKKYLTQNKMTYMKGITDIMKMVQEFCLTLQL